ncbi:hypothetical protein J4Q44_G00128180 [Coregonus suidteri]|uniref:XRN2-binding (XTBD) domain-containing protein n=1 Tax=Coregonus suidteri TaxID=861788 RepID=A0AAN8R011_9TELE
MAEGDIEEFIEQNRHLSELVDTYRGISETASSVHVVWANNVFLGCRYSPDLLEKVNEMAEGIVVEDAPVFKTRDEIMKNQKR